jgi:hypothetical protein
MIVVGEVRHVEEERGELFQSGDVVQASAQVSRNVREELLVDNHESGYEPCGCLLYRASTVYRENGATQLKPERYGKPLAQLGVADHHQDSGLAGCCVGAFRLFPLSHDVPPPVNDEIL